MMSNVTKTGGVMKCLLSAILLFLLCFSQAGSAKAATWQGSGVWSGAQDNGPATRVVGQFTVPTVSGYCGATSRTAVWVGLGGGVPFSQMGITLTPAGVGAWWEVFDRYGNTIERDVPFNPKTGDKVRLALWWANARTTLRMHWTNLTTGAALAVEINSAARYYSGDAAEWVIERQAEHNLAHFTTLTWYNAWYGREATYHTLQPATYWIEMVNRADVTQVATRFPADRRGMKMYWRRCT